jgi:hypothetical protein
MLRHLSGIQPFSRPCNLQGRISDVRSQTRDSRCERSAIGDSAWLGSGLVYRGTERGSSVACGAGCGCRSICSDQPEIDLREIFYGEPLLCSIINGCRQQFAHRDEIAQRVHVEWIEKRRHWNERYATEPQPDPESLTMHDLSRANDPEADIEYYIYYDTIRDIHADWLMSPCAELNDQLPRTVMLRDRDRLSGDMSDREEQWSTLEQCPAGISPESHAFQFSGFNTNEIVMYYDYVREVAWSCWDRLRTMSVGELAALQTSQIQLDGFVRDEVTRLRQVGEAWLDSRRTPRGIINLERRRQPNGGSSADRICSVAACVRAIERSGIITSRRIWRDTLR